MHHSALFNPPLLHVSWLQMVSPLSVSTLSRARQKSLAQHAAASSSAAFTPLRHFLVFLLIYLFILFCSCLVFLLPLQGRNACSKFKGGLWERARCFYLACVRVQASERTLLCPTLCLTQARLPGVVRLNASQWNADETSTPGRRQETTMHIVPEFCFRFSFIWSIKTLCCFLPLLYKK